MIITQTKGETFMKKRILCAALACIMVLTLGGCGGHSSSSDSTQKTVKIAEKSIPKIEYSLEEEVLEETKDFKFTVEGAKNDGNGGLLIDFALENKSNITQLFAPTILVNKCSLYVSYDLNSDKKNADSIKFDANYIIPSGETGYFRSSIPYTSLEDRNIESADEISILFYLCDETYLTSFRDNDKRYNLYPTGKTADDIVSPTRKKTKDEAVIVDNDDFKYVLYGIKTDDNGIYADVYKENNMDSEINFEWRNIKVNGKPYNTDNTGLSNRAIQMSISAHSIDYVYDCLYYEYLSDLSPSDKIEEISFTVILTTPTTSGEKEIYNADITWNPPSSN